MDFSHPTPDDMDDAGASRDRASERRNFFLGTTLVVDDRAPAPARVRNLSGGGMMVELTEEPDPEIAPGARVVAELRNIGRVKGEVAWSVGRRLGIKFGRTIDPEQARRPVGAGPGTPTYIKPVLLPDRALNAADKPRKR